MMRRRMADITERVDVELAIKTVGAEALQKMSAAVGSILEGITNIGKAGESTGQSGVAKSIQGMNKLTQETKEAAQSFDFMSKTLMFLAGPAGRIAAVASAVVGAGQALQDFAGNELQKKLRDQDVD